VPSADARLLARSSPAGLAHVCSRGRWTPYEHLILLNDKLLQVASGEIDRLMIWTPPRHGKSELVSRWASAWYLGTFPDRQVMLACYEATLARSWGRKAREVIQEHGKWVFDVGVRLEPRAADWWQLAGHEGTMVTAGVGGALTGKGADLLLIDDPIKNSEQASSQVLRDKQLDWWRSTASTRLHPGGAVIVVQTRWHEDDLSGRLLAEEGDRWTVVNLPALAEDNDDLLGRPEGGALCPELYDEDALRAIRRQVGSYFFSAMYQGRPAPPAGFLFKRQDFRYWQLERTPVGAIEQTSYVLRDGEQTRRFDIGQCLRFQVVDVAISSREQADWTVVSTWALTPDGDLLLLEIQRRHFEEQQTVDFLTRVNDEHMRPPMWIERFGAGRNPLARLARLGHPVKEIPAEAGAQLDKGTRAFGAIALCESHKLFFPAGNPDWIGAYEEELTGFPNAAHDDQVDVTSYAARLVPQLAVARPKHEQTAGPKPISAGVRSQQF
jgi:predicted phage terminase large subunit-like protein